MNASFHTEELKKLSPEAELVEKGHILNDWFVFRDSRHFGPLSTQQVKSFLTKKLISRDHYIWRPGFDDWLEIKAVEGFKSFGKESINTLSDDDFSYKAKLTYVDRVVAEAKSLNFEEGLVPEEIAEKNKPNKVLGFLAQLLGLEGPHINYGKLISATLVIAVVGAMVYKNNLINYRKELAQLPEIERPTFVEIASSSVSLSNPKIALYEKTEGMPEPVFIGASNIPNNTKIEFRIEALQGSLVNAYRFETAGLTSVQNGLFKFGPIRQDSGKFLPAGKYKISLICQSCKGADKLLYKKTHLLNAADASKYRADLRTFSSEARENVRLELDELEDLAYTLFGQYKTSADKFLSVSGSKKKYFWQNFSAQWLAKQNKLIDLFQQLKKPEFKESLFFLNFYESYSLLVKQIFELHMMQDALVSSGSEDFNKVKPLVDQIDSSLKSLKSQVEFARLNFSKTELLPIVE